MKSQILATETDVKSKLTIFFIYSGTVASLVFMIFGIILVSLELINLLRLSEDFMIKVIFLALAVISISFVGICIGIGIAKQQRE